MQMGMPCEYRLYGDTGGRVEEKIKEFKIKRRKSFEINEQFQSTKEKLHAQSDIRDVIRRRKGEPDKRISFELNKQ